MTEENKETKPEQEKPKEEKTEQKETEKKDDDNVIYIGSKPFKTCQSRLCVEV